MYAFCRIQYFCFKCEPLIKNFNQPYDCYRYVRNASKRNVILKTLKDFKVKDALDHEDYYNTVDYDDLSKRIKENDLEIEETFTKGENLDTIVSESGKIYDLHLKEERKNKSFLKKKLIGRKYFKLEKETNLLTHAAKEQIRFLNNSDPSEWTPEAIAKSFPISINGVKKLLRSNFVLTSPERIIEHDKDVKRKWEILCSGEKTEAISLYTQNLWNEGKLLKQNYNGNVNLPKNTSCKPKKSIEEITLKNKPIGEHAAIVQNFVEYKAQKDSLQKNNSDVTIRTENVSSYTKSEKSKYDDVSQKVRKISKYLRDDGKMKQKDEAELPFSQFKENIRQDLKFKSKKSSTHKQYYEWIEQDSKEEGQRISAQPYNPAEFVSQISKYDRKRSIEIKRDISKNSFYVYDEKLGYQNLTGQNIKRKIRLSNSLKKNNSGFKVGQCIYDEDGEFLFKLPS